MCIQTDRRVCGDSAGVQEWIPRVMREEFGDQARLDE